MPWKKEQQTLSDNQFKSLVIELEPGFPRKAADILKMKNGRQILAEHGVVEWEPRPKAPNSYTTLSIEGAVGDDYIGRYTVTGETVDAEIKNEVVAFDVRAERDTLLLESDKDILKVQRKIRQAERKGNDTAEFEAELSAWDDYRDDLCDVPEQEGFPNVIEWPVKP